MGMQHTSAAQPDVRRMSVGGHAAHAMYPMQPASVQQSLPNPNYNPTPQQMAQWVCVEGFVFLESSGRQMSISLELKLPEGRGKAGCLCALYNC